MTLPHHFCHHPDHIPFLLPLKIVWEAVYTYKTSWTLARFCLLSKTWPLSWLPWQEETRKWWPTSLQNGENLVRVWKPSCAACHTGFTAHLGRTHTQRGHFSINLEQSSDLQKNQNVAVSTHPQTKHADHDLTKSCEITWHCEIT